MKNHMKSTYRKAGLALLIAVAFLTPVSVVYAVDTTPPVISDITYDPHIGLRTSIPFFLWQCTVTDNVAVADARICINGPTGFTPVNDSLYPSGGTSYYYLLMSVPVSGTYQFTIWAKDTSGNSVRSASSPILVFETTLSYVHLDDSNSAGPWEGTAAYPLRYLEDALFIVATGGTIFVHEGQYNTSMAPIPSQLHLIGQNQATTIIDGLATPQYVLNVYNAGQVTFANLTVRNGNTAILLQGSSSATISHCTFSSFSNRVISMIGYDYVTITDCTFQDSYTAIHVSGQYNTVYHNNFINIFKPVTVAVPGTNNVWDNGATGNYWSDYRSRYPNANVIPATGTWDTAYMVNTTGNNKDNHPWVYPNGVIDTIPPQVLVNAPNGGEVLSGSISILWTASDDMSPLLKNKITIQYSSDNGGSWQTIAQNLSNTGSYLWDTSTVPNGNHYLVKVLAIDEFQNTGSDVSNAVFTIMNNMPPATPDQPSGPATGYVDVEYTYTTNPVTDPNGDNVSYFFDWDDGTNSGWLSTPTAKHTWIAAGAYDVKVKAKDTYDAESNWSSALPVTITEQTVEPVLSVESIAGGIGITAVIKNTGNATATNVSWTIALDGGIILVGKQTTGQVASLAAGQTATVKTLVLGFGLKTTITVSVTCNEGVSAQDSATGMVLLFLVLGVI